MLILLERKIDLQVAVCGTDPGLLQLIQSLGFLKASKGLGFSRSL